MPSCMVVFKGKAQSMCVADLLSADLVYMCVCFQGKAGQKMDACCVWLLMERGSWVCEEV